jgi:hypothetical protein
LTSYYQTEEISPATILEFTVWKIRRSCIGFPRVQCPIVDIGGNITRGIVPISPNPYFIQFVPENPVLQGRDERHIPKEIRRYLYPRI